ncbi:MAG: hypothetical protein K2G42_06515 [Clostridia bacterium]|nr:hypothetical protein [Clostridia bacterium]
MTARKRVISIISIISLILAITAGVLFSVVVQPNNKYVGESVRLSNTDVTVIAETSTKSSTTPDGVPEDAPDGAVAISTLDELKSFIRGEAVYGYLTQDIEDTLDWEGVGAQTVFATERTLNGNGFTIKLADSSSGNNGNTSGYAEGFIDPLETNTSIAGLAIRRNYGMLVDYNLGTIKNVKFVYNFTSATIKNNDQDGSGGDKTMYANYVGIVCGTNTGRIENCDLNVSGAFTFNYENGKIGDDSDNRNNRFDTFWGGIAGRNGGVIKNITAQYKDFTLNIYTNAQNTKTGSIGNRKPTEARSFGGGIAGKNALNTASVSEIVILGSNVNFNMTASGQTAGLTSANTYRGYGSVVCSNSSYSHGVGASADAQGKVDNIIVDFEVVNNNHNMGDYVSRNSVVFCGKSTDVTILKTTDKTVNNQHVDYQTDNCNCGVSGNDGEHQTGYGNLIHTGEYSNVTVGFDEQGNQVITVEPKDKEKSMLGEIAFTKYEKRGTVTDGSLEPGVEDTATYTNVASNGSTYLYNKVDIRQDKYTFTIRPYQALSNKYWEIGAYSYQIATISNVGSSEYTYTGEDFLLNQLSYTTLAGDKSGVVNPEGLNASTAEGKAVKSGRLPGEYTFVLAEKEAGLSYVDTQNKVVAFVEEEPLTQYSFNVNLAKITPLNADLIGENWMTEQQDFTFELTGGIEGAADGYQYEVGGSLPTPVSGLVMQNRQDTNSAGRTYKIELTSGGVVVTEPYTYTVKIDLTAPIAEITHYEHPADRYYTHNKITIEATDRASGVASIVMNSYDGDSTTPTHSHDIMTEGIDNGDGTYTWRFQDTGRKEIVVTDNAGHTSTIEVNVKIDTTMPTLTVDAYYFVEEDVESGTDSYGNPIYTTVQKKVPFTNDTGKVSSAVYFEASATFGESGGEIRYSLDNGSTWTVYEDVVTVKSEQFVKFRAVSNTYDHPEDDVYPYPNRYPLVDNWGNQTMHVVIDLPKVVITLEDLVIENSVKTFDGTDTFFGNVSIRDGFEEKNEINGEVQITSVVYADINASDSVTLIISVFCTDDTKMMDNQIEGAIGKIEKKVIDVTIDSKTKIYGVSLPELTYTQNGMVEGFEENVGIYVQKPDGYTGTYELLPQTADGEGYVIAVVDGTTFVNYTLGNVTEGRLRVTLAPVDRLVYERGQFTGLDLNNIADRNLEIGFIRSNGNYERLNVTFYARDYYYDSGTEELVDNGYTKKVDDITKAGAGFFKVVISLPEYDANGELLTNKYVMDEDITEFMIKIIDSTIFDVKEEEEPTEPVDDKTEQQTPTVNNGANSNGQVSIYEDNSANTDSTDIDIESAQQQRDYVAMISIFCAVAITIAFAIGVGRAIAKRIRR